MTIGSSIKALRRKADMTQEHLAELLGVSASAVSQWECDRVLPDVTQIPVLADIFSVSADVILGIDREKTDGAVREILDAAREAMQNADWEKAEEILRHAHRKYPRSYVIMERLANALVNVYSRKGMREYSEVFRLCRTILDECTDSEIRYRTLDLLVTAYDYAGMKEKMLETAAQMPSFAHARESAMLWRWSFEEEEGLRSRQEYLSDLLTELVTALSLIAGHRQKDHSPVYAPQERIALYRQIVTVIETLFPDGDCMILAQQAESACADLAGEYLRLGDTEGAAAWIARGCDYAVHFDTYDFDAEHTSPAFRGYAGGGWIRENGQSHSAVMLHWLESDTRTEEIRTNPRVLAVMERLRRTAE
ncbi:MAG: helix-turn-helix domain-containing protein [Clostridia bacterium]|nr:helix-turn-helix domain-containing protein [Clostridia bacterium]